MKVTNLDLPVMSSWIEDNALRLDSAPYLSGAMEARILLDRLRVEKVPLHQLTKGHNGGIYNGPQFVRNYVDDPAHGVPFLTSSSMLLADLSTAGLLRKKDAESPKLNYLRLREGMTLISCSGTIGRMVYARPAMEGMWSSQDILKVVPDPNKILPGYLFAYLSSRFGVPLVVFGTYGAIIQHIEPHHIAALPVPRLGESIERKINDLIVSAAHKRSNAALKRKHSIKVLYKHFELNSHFDENKPHGFSSFSVSSTRLSRLDAFTFSPNSLDAYEELIKCSDRKSHLYEVANVFTPGIFKRQYVDDPNFGYPYFSGSELFQVSPNVRGYLNKKSQGIENYIVKKDWLLIQDAGQVGGLIGRLIRIQPFAHNSAVSNHLMRIVPKNHEDSGYLFTVLSSPHGYRSVVRHAFGTSIPQLDPSHVRDIIIPWPESKIRQEISESTFESWKLFDQAEEEEKLAIAMVDQAIEGGN